MRSIAYMALAALLLAACSAARPVSLPEARGFCNTAGGGISAGTEDSGGGSCKDQLNICSRYFDPLAAGVKDRASCLAQCAGAQSVLFHIHAMDDCRRGVARGNDLCEQYCRGNFK